MNRVRLLMLIAVVLAGCESKPTNFYYLEALGSPAEIPSDQAARLAIEEVNVPRYLDRPDIVSQESGTGLKVSDVDQWAEPLKFGIARVLQGDLAHLLAKRPIMVVPADFTDADAELFVQVSRFEVTAAGEAVVEAHWRIVRTDDGVELIIGRSEHRQIYSGDGYLVVTAALNEALHGLSRDIADAAAKLVN